MYIPIDGAPIVWRDLLLIAPDKLFDDFVEMGAEGLSSAFSTHPAIVNSRSAETHLEAVSASEAYASAKHPNGEGKQIIR